MDVGPTFVSNHQPAVVGYPRKVRSTTHRQRPNLSLLSTPRLAILTFMPRLRRNRRQRG